MICTTHLDPMQGTGTKNNQTVPFNESLSNSESHAFQDGDTYSSVLNERTYAGKQTEIQIKQDSVAGLSMSVETRLEGSFTKHK